MEPELDPSVLVESLEGSLDLLVVCLSHSWGGLEQVAANDAADAAGLGLRVRVMVLQGSPIHENLAHRQEIELLPLEFRPRNTLDLKLRTELFRLIESGVSLVHTHQTSLLGSIAPWLYGRGHVGLIASRHIMSDHVKRTFFHRLIYRRVDALCVMSQTMRDNVRATFPIRERQLKVIHLGLDFEKFDPKRVDPSRQRAQWGADSSTLVVGLVGRIDPAKGQATLIKAAAGLLKNAKAEKIKFVIVGEETLGSSGGHLQSLREMVAQFGIGDHVVFAGYQENIPEVMRAFDVFVMPSRQEAFGLVAIESLAMERPIIISNSGSALEIIGKEEFGLLVKPDDAFDLQCKLREMLDRPDLRHQMGAKGRAHVMVNYGRTARIRKTLELYERTLRRRLLKR